MAAVASPAAQGDGASLTYSTVATEERRRQTEAVFAIKRNYQGLFTSFVESAGADKKIQVAPVFSDGADSLLHVASFYIRPDLVNYLLEKGADANAKNKAGLTPMWTLIQSYLKRTANRLPRAQRVFSPPILDFPRAEVDLDGELKVLAVEDQNQWKGNWDDLVKTFYALTGAGADVNYIPPSGRSILYETMLGGREAKPVTDLLLDSRLLIDMSNPEGQTLLVEVLSTEYPRKIGVVVRLVKEGCSVNTIDKLGRTPLHYLANAASMTESSDDIDVLKYLLHAGARPNEQDGEGRTPLHISIEKGGLTFARTLLEIGAVGDIRDKAGVTALWLLLNEPEPVDENIFASVLYLILTYSAYIRVKDNRSQLPYWLRSPSNPYVLLDDCIAASQEVNSSANLALYSLRLKLGNVLQKAGLMGLSPDKQFALEYFTTLQKPITAYVTNRTMQLLDEKAAGYFAKQLTPALFIPKPPKAAGGGKGKGKKGKKGKK